MAGLTGFARGDDRGQGSYGFVDGQNDVAVTVNRPALSDANAGQDNAIELIIADNMTTVSVSGPFGINEKQTRLRSF